MHRSAHECGIRDIPRRLHTLNRPVLDILGDRDRIFIRHEPLPNGEKYGGQIPGHKKLEDQSANSESINTPGGYACDVLFDTKRGEHYFTYQIACLNVLDVRSLKLPNEKTIIKDRQGNITKPADIYTFVPLHKPTACMYPHCIIEFRKNGISGKEVSNGMKTMVRLQFADLAEKNRLEMVDRIKREAVEWKKEIDRLNNPKWWHLIVERCWERFPSPFKKKLQQLCSAWREQFGK